MEQESVYNKLALVDKPSGVTSFDVIRVLRRELSTKKLGHAGTLDPMATGLLIIGVDKGTKLLTEIMGSDKTYRAVIQFGLKTTTGDKDGEILKDEISEIKISKSNLDKSIKELIGSNILEVSKYSAVKQGGEPIYKKARRGDKNIIIPKREMLVHEAVLENYNETLKQATVFFNVASGTYIRSLGEFLGEKLSTVASLDSLERLSIGDYSLKKSNIDFSKEDISKLFISSSHS